MTGDVSRRDLVRLLAIAAAAGIDPRRLDAADGPERLLEFEPLGNVTLLHLTDTHATTRPVFYREPDTLIGVGDERGRPPFLTGAELLRAYHLAPGTAEAYAYTYLDFPALAARYGRMGGYAHLATLVKRVRAARPGRTLLLDGGDTLQGSAPALWSRGEDMVRVSNQLGVDGVQALVNELRDDRKADLVVLLSHNGISVDRKLAARVRGLDVILGGHTHDALPQPIVVGRTLVVNSGSHGKFLSRLDLDVRRGRIAAHRYRLIPVLARHVPEDAEMAQLLRELGSPWEAKLGERLAVSESLLYRRGNFNGTFDELILDALLKRFDAQVAFSPGFRWGVTILPGQEITLADVYAHTALTYANTWVRELTGREIHATMEDVADNLFHPDPYYRQGGDMVRLGGLTYAIDPAQALGRRISDIRVGAQPLEPARRYKTAGWASVATEADGPPAWDVVADHLRRLGRIRLDPRPRVRVV